MPNHLHLIAVLETQEGLSGAVSTLTLRGEARVGFGSQYANFPGGKGCFCRFLSSGNADDEQGEHYLKDPAAVDDFIEEIPITDIPTEYVIYKPLSEVDLECETPVSVVFFSDPDHFSALGVLANYSYPGNENVLFPFAAGCQAIGIYSYREAERENPKAIAGPMDLSARLYLRRQFGENIMSMSISWQMFLTMEENVAGSFLERHTWSELLKTK